MHIVIKYTIIRHSLNVNNINTVLSGNFLHLREREPGQNKLKVKENFTLDERSIFDVSVCQKQNLFPMKEIHVSTPKIVPQHRVCLNFNGHLYD